MKYPKANKPVALFGVGYEAIGLQALRYEWTAARVCLEEHLPSNGKVIAAVRLLEDLGHAMAEREARIEIDTLREQKRRRKL